MVKMIDGCDECLAWVGGLLWATAGGGRLRASGCRGWMDCCGLWLAEDASLVARRGAGGGCRLG